MKELPIDYLNECLTYNSETGILTWKTRPESHFSSPSVARRFNNLYAGKPAGGRVANGYLMLPFKDETGKRCLFYAHRIAFAMHHGRFPQAELDHINGVKTDNRATNLREAVRLQNAANTIFNVQNQRGAKRHKDGRWSAQISYRNQNIYLGLYSTEAEAHAAFCGAATVLRKEFVQLTHERD